MTRPTAWRQWLLWSAIVITTTVAMLSIRDRLDKVHVALVYLLAVLGASAAAGRAIGLSLAAASFLAFNYFFLPPYNTLVIANPFDWIVLLAFLVTGIVAAQLLYRARSKTDVALARAQEVDRLAALGAETLAAPSALDAMRAIAEVIRRSLDAQVVELYRQESAGIGVVASGSARGIALMRMARASDLALSPDNAIAPSLTSWLAADLRQTAVLADGTTRLEPESMVGLELSAIHRLLTVRDLPVGVLLVRFAEPTTLSADRARMLDALAYYAALGVERVRLESNAERAEAERRVESLRNALLMSVSHDLRSPLTTIKALAHELTSAAPSNAARIIESEADRLDVLVGDLLDLSRIHAGAVRSESAVNTVDELIGAALQGAHGVLASRAVAVSLPDALLLARFDVAQTVRIVVNLLENAAKYTPASRAIEIAARQVGDVVEIEVADEGAGVPPGEESKIFEPFYRPAGTPPDARGAGLGLSIARGLAEAQEGTLTYRPRTSGGAAFVLSLPAAEPPPEELTGLANE